LFAIPWYVAVLESIPEAFLVIIVGFALYDYHVPYSRAFIMSVISAVCTYFIRQLPVMFGVHTVLGIIILAALAVLVLRTRPVGSLVAIMTGIIMLLTLQTFMAPLLFSATSTTVSDLTIRPWLNIVFFSPQAVILIAFYAVITRRRFSLYRIKWE